MSITTIKKDRQQDLQAFKRQKILNAASQLFREKGLDGTTMRAIAKAAGYSTGAPYAYFQSKEEIYAALLSASLGHLTQAVKQASSKHHSASQNITQTFSAFFEYYHTHPEELQLGLYLFSSGEISKQGFSTETNNQLNGKLLGLLGYMANNLHQESSLTAKDAQIETLDAITYFIGALLLEASGRLEIMGTQSEEMIDRYMVQMLERVDLE